MSPCFIGVGERATALSEWQRNTDRVTERAVCACVYFTTFSFSYFQCVSVFYALATLFSLNSHANKAYWIELNWIEGERARAREREREREIWMSENVFSKQLPSYTSLTLRHTYMSHADTPETWHSISSVSISTRGDWGRVSATLRAALVTEN